MCFLVLRYQFIYSYWHRKKKKKTPGLEELNKGTRHSEPSNVTCYYYMSTMGNVKDFFFFETNVKDITYRHIADSLDFLVRCYRFSGCQNRSELIR